MRAQLTLVGVAEREAATTRARGDAAAADGRACRTEKKNSDLMRWLVAAVVVSLCGAFTLPPIPIDAKRLILVRHGAVARELHDPPIPPGALYGGNLEVPLSKQGEAEAVAAADMIGEFAASGEKVQFVASSPMKRALYGADLIAEAIQPHNVGRVDVSTYELLREIERGEWVNLTREQIAERWGADAFERAALEDDFGHTFGGEGMGDLRDRVLTARDFILKKVRDGGAAVVVSHMWVTRVMVADALGEPSVLNVDIPTASISVIDYGPDAWPPVLATEPASVPVVGFKPAVTEGDRQEQQAQ